MPQFQAALKRALVAALVAAAPLLLNFLHDYNWPAEYSAYILILVRVGEGVYDSYRNAAGKVSQADVGQPA